MHGLGFLRMWENMDQENLKNRQFHIVQGSAQSPGSVFQALFPYKDAWQIVKYFFLLIAFNHSKYWLFNYLRWVKLIYYVNNDFSRNDFVYICGFLIDNVESFILEIIQSTIKEKS